MHGVTIKIKNVVLYIDPGDSSSMRLTLTPQFGIEFPKRELFIFNFWDSYCVGIRKYVLILECRQRALLKFYILVAVLLFLSGTGVRLKKSKVKMQGA